MSRHNSALRIFLYNWPIYATTWAIAAGGLAVYVIGRATVFAVLLAVLPMVWSSISLAVSWYIYDRSALRHGAWLKGLLPNTVGRWASIHAGLDAEVKLRGVMPGECAGYLDIFDPNLMPAGSIARARQKPSEEVAVACPPSALALPDATCDAIVVAFSAHEIHDPKVREQLFAELRRCLRRKGRVILIEHVRDLANFLVFGPGHMHFLPRKEWLRLAAHGGFSVADEKRITPWVMALSLEMTQ